MSFCFVPFRLGVRYKVFNKLYVDDALVVLAWLLLFGHCLALDLYCDDLFGVLNTSAGLEPPSENIFQQLQGYFNVLVITTFLSPFCLWSIKASFLVFFRRLLVGVRKHERVWLVVTIYVAISFCVWMGCVQWKCTIGSVQEHLGKSLYPVPINSLLILFRTLCRHRIKREISHGNNESTDGHGRHI